MISKKQQVNLAGYALMVLIGGYILTKSVESMIGSFEGLSTLGLPVYIASWVFISGLIFLSRREDNKAAICMELLLLIGFLGTSLGFTEYLQAHAADAASTDLGGIKHAFLANAQGILYASILLVVSLGTKQDEMEEVKKKLGAKQDENEGAP